MGLDEHHQFRYPKPALPATGSREFLDLVKNKMTIEEVDFLCDNLPNDSEYKDEDLVVASSLMF